MYPEKEEMTDKEQLNPAAPVKVTNEPPKSSNRWHRYCVLALVLSVLSVAVCTMTWLQNVALHRHVYQLQSQLDDLPNWLDLQLDARFDQLLLKKQPSSSHIRTIRQVAAESGDCGCPPGRTHFFIIVSTLSLHFTRATMKDELENRWHGICHLLRLNVRSCIFPFGSLFFFFLYNNFFFVLKENTIMFFFCFWFVVEM